MPESYRTVVGRQLLFICDLKLAQLLTSLIDKLWWIDSSRENRQPDGDFIVVGETRIAHPRLPMPRGPRITRIRRLCPRKSSLDGLFLEFQFKK